VAKKKVESASEAILRFALELPEAWEDHPWNETVLKVGKKVFVFFGSPAEPLAPSVTVKLTASHHEALQLEGCNPSGYGLGKSGWVSFPITSTPVDVACDFIEESYRNVAPKKLIAQIK
jgi:predicted DNA-binding protein (MmcQ/YjbR family)